MSLQRKYWKDDVKPHPDIDCPDVGKADEVSDTALKPENMIGVFLVIICGVIIGMFFALMEYCIFKCKKKNQTSTGFCKTFLSDIIFAIKCWEESSKEVVRATRPPPSPSKGNHVGGATMSSSHHSHFDDANDGENSIPFRGLIPPSRVVTPYQSEQDRN